MAKIAFLLMAHKDPERVVEQAMALTAHGDCVAIHFDARAPAAAFEAIRRGLAGVAGVAFARRVRCGWGQFSLVEATLNLIRTARRAFEGVTHYYLMSGDCYPTKSRGYIERYLEADIDVIESRDFFSSGWIRTGLRDERLIYRHWFNERERPWLFYRSLALQRRLGLDRAPPEGLAMRIGSQWWMLRAATVERLLAFLRGRRDIVRFFRTTWIPDETFFQTLVAHLVPPGEIREGPPTHLIFSDYGMPIVFHRDHLDYLRADERPFARKLSPHAAGLHRDLLDGFRAWDAGAPEGGASGKLYDYLAGRGRTGQRYAPRFWEHAIGPRRDAGVLIVVAKLWHVGAPVADAAARVAEVPHLGYVFDEAHDIDVALGNLECGLEKRGRHRRALLNQVFDALGAGRVMLAVDPSRTGAIADIAEQAGDVRLLLVERPISDDHIRGHAARVGLLGPNSGAFERDEVMHALAREFAAETDHLRRAYRGRLWVNRLDRPREDNIVDIGHFLRAPRVKAEAIAREAEKHVH